jgi:vancomycin resistance protein YoaR
MVAYVFACLSLFFPMFHLSSTVQPILHLTYEQQDWYLDLHQVGFDGVDPTTLNRQQVHQWFYRVASEIDRLPRNAHYNKNREAIHEQLGRKVDIAQMDDWLDLIHIYLNQPLQVPTHVVYPELTVQELRQLKGKSLASYTTHYNKNMYNRAHNVELSAKAIDHHVVMPGEVFSFNEVVGKRTVARGYRKSKIIVKGEYSEGIGGGICQTSSTLFNSIDRANLQIVERISHSRQVPYVPKKRDATVSWGGPDFKFKNTYDQPILIVSKAKGGNLTVQIFTKK